MKRTTSFACFFLAATSFASSAPVFAQDYSPKPKTPKPDALPGQQLIVWTETQKPHPVPGSSDEIYPAAQVRGMIVAQGSDLFLAIESGPSYRIENGEQLSRFAGRRVQVNGNINPARKTIQVLALKPQ